MDAVIMSTIASAAVSLLASYLKSMGEGFAKKTGEQIGEEAGESAWGKTKQIYDVIKAKFVSKPESTKVMAALEKSPDDKDTQASVRFHLKDMMASDKGFAGELATLLKEASDLGADTVFRTNIYGDVQKFVQIGNVSGDVNI